MPKTDTIILSPADLKAIQETLIAKQHKGAFKLVDQHRSFIIRDLKEGKIAEIKKQPL